MHLAGVSEGLQSCIWQGLVRVCSRESGKG